MKLVALKSDLTDLTGLLEDLRKKVYEPAAYIYYGTDHFLDKTGTNTAHAAYDAVVNEGIRFPSAGSAIGGARAPRPEQRLCDAVLELRPAEERPGIRMDLTGYSVRNPDGSVHL